MTKVFAKKDYHYTAEGHSTNVGVAIELFCRKKEIISIQETTDLYLVTYAPVHIDPIEEVRK